MNFLTKTISASLAGFTLILALALTGCGPELFVVKPLPEPKGKLTVNAIPAAYNGKYIYVTSVENGIGGKTIAGFTDFVVNGKNDVPYKLVRISGGTAVVPLYYVIDDYTFGAYEGNDPVSGLVLLILRDAEGADGLLDITEASSVATINAARKNLGAGDGTFNNGNLTVTW